MLSSPPGAIGKVSGESEFKDSPDKTKYLYIHPLCGGGQSATHHGAFVEWEYLDMATVELRCRNCGKVETHKLEQRGGLRNPKGGRPPKENPREKHSPTLAPGTKELAQAIAKERGYAGWGYAIDEAIKRLAKEMGI